jgi:hypothetical protein
MPLLEGRHFWVKSPENFVRFEKLASVRVFALVYLLNLSLKIACF